MENTEHQQNKEKKALIGKRKVHLDDVFKEYIGEGGKYQLLVVVMLSLNAFCASGIHGDIIWVTDVKSHWCGLPDDANPVLQNMTLEKRHDLTIPLVEVDGKKVRDSCHMYKLNYSTLNPWDTDHLNTSVGIETTECSSWDFDTSELKNTIVEKWNMVCDRRILIATTQSVYLASLPIGSLMGGFLSDRFGRRKTILFVTLVPMIFRATQIFAPNLTVYMISSFFVGALYQAPFAVCFTLGLEIVGPKYRYLMGLLNSFWWTIGATSSTGIAYLIKERVSLQLVISIPLLFYLSYIFLVPESPRWLIAKGRISEANKILHRFAKWNNTKYPEEELDIAQDNHVKFNVHKAATSRTVLVRFFILALGWWSVNFVITGLAMNATNIIGNIYLNMFILYMAELPGNFLCMKLINTRLGRRFTVAGSISISGILLLLVAIIPEDHSILIRVLVMISKSLAIGGFASMYTVTAELFPSEMRSGTISILTSSGKCLCMLTPFIAYLAVYSKNLPLLILGSLPTLTGPVMLLLPETRGRPLPQTLEDVENMSRGSCFKPRQKNHENEKNAIA